MAIKDAFGIIGRGMQDVAPVLAAKEKALRETETASLIRQEDKYKFLIQELGKTETSLLAALDPDNPIAQSLNQAQFDSINTRLEMVTRMKGLFSQIYLGQITMEEPQIKKAIEEASKVIVESQVTSSEKSTKEDSSIIPDWLKDFGEAVGATALEGLQFLGNKELDIFADAVGTAIDYNYDNLFSKKKIELGSERSYTAERGKADLDRDAVIEVFKDLKNKIGEEGVVNVLKESLKGKISPGVANFINKFLGANYSISIPPDYIYSNSQKPQKKGLISQGSESGNTGNITPGVTYNDGKFTIGVGGMTAPGTIFEGDVGQAEQMMMEGGQLGGSEITATEPASETVTFEDPFSEEAINYRLSQQPWNDPNVMEMGAVDVYPTNIPKESEDIEVKKSGLIRELAPLVKAAESNVNGYNAVAGSTKGDSDLTNMTIKEIREKYGDKAVGVGQFKYGVFIRPIAEKYLGMTAEQLDNVVFSKTFQDQLIALAAEDAGITQFLKGQISNAEFQKRFANIFRGMGASKTSKPGDTVDKYGNKVRTGGGLINEVLKEY
jgi:hypothetical protein